MSVLTQHDKRHLRGLQFTFIFGFAAIGTTVAHAAYDVPTDAKECYDGNRSAEVLTNSFKSSLKMKKAGKVVYSAELKDPAFGKAFEVQAQEYCDAGFSPNHPAPADQ